LWHYSISQQTKHIRDITSIVMTLGDELEIEYIETWVTKKGLLNIWRELVDRIQSKQ
jgi:protoheme ferro-lyase